jgi:hypothetical protein
MNLKELVENNAGVFALTLVVSGFLSGIACYEAILRIAELTTISQLKLDELNGTIQSDIQARAASDLKLAERDLDIKRLTNETISLKVQLVRNELAGLDGDWINEDANSGGITRFSIQHHGDEILVHAWGKCHPTDCDWGEQKALVDRDSAIVIWDQKFALDRMVVKLNTSSKLNIDEVRMIGDLRGRRDIHSTFLFQPPSDKPKAYTEPAKDMNAPAK